MSMLADSRYSPYFGKARLALQSADKGFDLPQGTYHPTHMAAVGLSHPACFAAFRWLAASLDSNNSNLSGHACQTSVLSASKLPTGDTESNILELGVIYGQSISCQLSAKHACKGAGGRRVYDKQDGSEVAKKGPDTWWVTAQCVTPGAGSFCVTLRIQWDIYTCEGMQTYQYNQFRVVGCDNLDGFQQWCKEAVSAAAELGTDETALNQCAQLPASNASAYNTEALRLSENSSTMALGSKRSRVALDTIPSGGSLSSSDSTELVSRLEQRFNGLHLRLSNTETTVWQHAGRLDRLYNQVQEHNDDSVQLHFQNARPSSEALTSTADNNAPHHDKSSYKLQDLFDPENDCTTLQNSPLSGDDEFSDFLNDTSFLCDPCSSFGAPNTSTCHASSAPVSIPPAANIGLHPGAAQPAMAAAHPAATGCPAFDANLAKEEIEPFVLQALLSIRPQSCSALDLTKHLWPQETAMRSCMKRVISGVLYSNAVSPKVIQNGTHWSHK